MGEGIPILRMLSTMDPLLKNVRRSGYSSAICAPDPIHILEAADFVRRLKRHLNGGGIRSRIARVERGEIGNDTDIGDDHVKIGRGHHFADEVLDFRHILFGDFDTGTSGNFQIDRKLTGVGSRKKCNAEERIDGQAGDKRQHQNCRP